MEEYISRSAALGVVENAAMHGRNLSYVYHELQEIPATAVFGYDFAGLHSSDSSPQLWSQDAEGR